MAEAIKCPTCGEPMHRWYTPAGDVLGCKCGERRPIGWTGDAPVTRGIRPDPNAVMAVAISAAVAGDTRLLEKVDGELHDLRTPQPPPPGDPQPATPAAAEPMGEWGIDAIRRHLAVCKKAGVDAPLAMLRAEELIALVDALAADRDAFRARAEAAEACIATLRTAHGSVTDEAYGAVANAARAAWLAAKEAPHE